MRRIDRHFVYSTIGSDGVITFLLSNLVLILTLGSIYLLMLFRAVKIAVTAPSQAEEPGDMALVLGYQLKTGGQIAVLYKQRLDRGIDYLHRHSEKKIHIMGGATSEVVITEAQAGRDYLMAAGIAENSIEMEQQSQHTLENLYQFRERFADDYRNLQIFLITSRYHLSRALVLARSLGLNAKPLAAEGKLQINPAVIFGLLKEAYLLHWYYVGKYWSVLTQNEKNLERIQ